MTVSRKCPKCGENGLLSIKEVDLVYNGRLNGSKKIVDRVRNNPHQNSICEHCYQGSR